MHLVTNCLKKVKEFKEGISISHLAHYTEGKFDNDNSCNAVI